MTATHDDQPPSDGATGHLGDDVVDLALGHVAGERRAAMAAHLSTCAACRADYDEVRRPVDDLVVAAPEVQPPIGFDERTLARMGVEGSGGVVPLRARAPRRRWVPVAAAAAVLAVVAIAVGAWVVAGATTGTTDPQVAAIATADGRDVGTATRTEVDGEPVLVVGLVDGTVGASYTCRMRFADGSTLDTDPWAAAPGAAWLVPLPDDRGALTEIELLSTADATSWSAASF